MNSKRVKEVKFDNPCFEEGELSKKCLEKNDYKNNDCYYYFENYKACKRFWGRIQRERKKAGIKPHMPTNEERQVIKEKKEKGIHVISW